jgi:hypothetical protein
MRGENENQFRCQWLRRTWQVGIAHEKLWVRSARVSRLLFGSLPCNTRPPEPAPSSMEICDRIQNGKERKRGCLAQLGQMRLPASFPATTYEACADLCTEREAATTGHLQELDKCDRGSQLPEFLDKDTAGFGKQRTRCAGTKVRAIDQTRHKQYTKNWLRDDGSHGSGVKLGTHGGQSWTQPRAQRGASWQR